MEQDFNPLSNLVADGGYTAIFRTIGVIGDSLSSGEHESTDEKGERGYHDYYEYSWGQFIARKCGLTCYNFSKGGLTAKTFNDHEGEGKLFYLKNNPCQAYIIALGANDITWCKSGAPFGSMDDVNFDDYEKNAESFVGQYVKIIQKIRAIEPKCRIFVVTMPKDFWEKSEPDIAEFREKHADFLRSLTGIFEFLYVVDLRKYGAVYDEKFSEIYYCGGHLNAMGYKYTADVISTYIDFIIRNNYKDFSQVAFIGKGVHNFNEKW
ncbi:MAG: SGNH/GDSL hydrolase family protein [Clostridia bacterium]|nr:SGNH/GDSL hydrolase family protein [Clostridia bacterium]